MAKTLITCPICESDVWKEVGHVNRARRLRAGLYCDRECAGIARRSWKPDEQKKREKAEYDRQRRAKLTDRIKAEKAAYHKRTYDPVKAREQRKRRMPAHVEYCRRPEYQAKKKAYDRVYRAKKDYGDLWECQVLALQVRDAALERMSDYEIRLSKGTMSKAQKRKRDYERTIVRKEPESGPLGNLEQGQRR